jgi:hypothetical protein
MSTANFRARRSDDRFVATVFQLEQILEDFNLAACVVVDEAGRVVASVARNDEDIEWSHEIPTIARLGRRRRGVSVCEFRANGRPMFVATVGNKLGSRDLGMYRAVLGLRRIHR